MGGDRVVLCIAVMQDIHVDYTHRKVCIDDLDGICRMLPMDTHILPGRTRGVLATDPCRSVEMSGRIPVNPQPPVGRCGLPVMGRNYGCHRQLPRAIDRGAFARRVLNDGEIRQFPVSENQFHPAQNPNN
jgi:hypothetical protein